MCNVYIYSNVYPQTTTKLAIYILNEICLFSIRLSQIEWNLSSWTSWCLVQDQPAQLNQPQAPKIKPVRFMRNLLNYL